MENPNSSNKFVPVMVILLIVASFLIGSLYTQVNFLKKGNSGNVAGTNNAAGQVAGTGTANPNQPLQPEPTPQPVDVDVSTAQVQGKEGAKVAVVEFTDYQCPFCGRLFTDTFPQIKKEYIDTGKIKYYVMDFPLTQIHPQAQKTAEGSHCALEQNKFWEYHDKVFANQTALQPDDLKKYAGELGLNTEQFGICLDSGKYASKVSDAQKLGENYGVQGTPASFVGVISGNTVKQAIEVSGAQPFTSFKSVIDEALKKS